MIRKAYPITHLLLIILTIIGAGIVIVALYVGFVPIQSTPYPHASVTITEHANNTTTIMLTDKGTAEKVYVQTNNTKQNLQVGKPVTITTTQYVVIAELKERKTTLTTN